MARDRWVDAASFLGAPRAVTATSAYGFLSHWRSLIFRKGGVTILKLNFAFLRPSERVWCSQTNNTTGAGMAQPSRIFIRGLPPNMSGVDFASHFSSTSPITDAKHISHRRIGYVGYRNHESAKAAVKYFHRSFVRTSRIHVELARPVDQDAAGKRDTWSDARRTETRKPRSPVPSDVTNPSQETRKAGTLDQRFPNQAADLSVPSPQSQKRNFEQDEPVHEAAKPEASGVIETQSPAVPGESGDNPAAAKRRRVEDDTEQIIPTSEEGENESHSPNQKDGVDAANSVTAAKHNHELQQRRQASDSDWLRSRTSRVLDLINDEELNKVPNDESQGPMEDSSSPVVAHEMNAQTPAEEPRSALEQSGTVPRPVYAASSDPRRLFVRNLSYETTEAGLENLFQDFGAIEEVCRLPTLSRGCDVIT